VVSELRLSDLEVRLKDCKKLKTKTSRPRDYSEHECRIGKEACLHMLDYLLVIMYLMRTY